MFYTFTTFASTGFEDTRDRIVKEAEFTHLFSAIFTYNEMQLSEELLKSPTFQIKKGYGLYSWKPDVIWKTLQKVMDGDVVVYLDAGCSIYPCKEWQKLFNKMCNFDVIAFNIHQRNYQWTRRSVFDYFKDDIPYNWKDLFQFGANALIVKKTPIGMDFISEWRDIMINRLDLCGDVPEEELSLEDKRFIENRYDQTIMTALLYKYMATGKVKAVWEHFEGKDIFKKQAFIASRKRKGRNSSNAESFKKKAIRILRTYIYYPLFGNSIFYINHCKR